ncbi:molybdenum cofactor guanylyltransferase [Oculatella sp. LEGE 06141]|uniref:molybdenum cofactor guanylyltransferase n=1 Tax=Oculatella sp. LEGE 06141 TaxID=1828648 RepID=UPI00187E1549|nr:molybdenum cofactor guanylyltransferase [Oculatella sp. LEGE 06141]
MDQITAMILAGGHSSRMGQDKALISVQGTPMIQRVYQIADQCAVQVYVVTPWIARYRELLPSHCRFVQEAPLPDGIEMNGPLVGFAQGLMQVETEWVLLLACDLPRLQVDVLHSWMTQLSTVPDEAIAFLPSRSVGWEPLCGFYRKRCMPLLWEFVEEGGRSFQRWLSKHPVQTLPLPDPDMLFNCNTPDDLSTVKAMPID